MAEESALPEGWTVKESKSRPGVRYYWCAATGETTWELPTSPPAGSGGKRKRDASGGGGGKPSAAERAKARMRAQLTEADGAQVRALHLLRKHAGSRRPASWREDPIVCSKARAALRAAAVVTRATGGCARPADARDRWGAHVRSTRAPRPTTILRGPSASK